MTEEAPLDLPEEIVNFEVPSVPQFYNFGHVETPEEVARRESFFIHGHVPEDKENAQGAEQPQFKVPAPPPLMSNSSSDISTATSSVSTAQAVSPVDLSQLAAFRGPRAPLRRSNMNAASQSAAQSTTNGAPSDRPQSTSSQPDQQKGLSAGAAAAARAAARRRSASVSKAEAEKGPQRGRTSTSSRVSAAGETANNELRVPRVRASSSSRQTRPASPGVVTRAMAAAAAASAPTTADGDVAQLTEGVARIQLARVPDRQSRQPAGVRPASGAVRVAPPAGVPVRVTAPLRAADRALAASSAARPQRPTVGTTPRGGVAVATASGVVGSRPNSALRKPSAASISRLSQPRERAIQPRDVASTPKREFSKVLRAYPRDNRPAGTVTIPDTPAFVRRASAAAAATQSAVSSAAAPPSTTTGSVSRPHVDVARLVNRLSQPRTVPVAPANGAAIGGTLPPLHSRRLPAVPVGRTHGLPVVRRTTTNALAAPSASAIRSRSNSAARAARTAGGLAEGAESLRAEQQQ